jgi:hypothetical protein
MKADRPYRVSRADVCIRNNEIKITRVQQL